MTGIIYEHSRDRPKVSRIISLCSLFDLLQVVRHVEAI
jgi:hypothetical protein